MWTCAYARHEARSCCLTSSISSKPEGTAVRPRPHRAAARILRQRYRVCLGRLLSSIGNGWRQTAMKGSTCSSRNNIVQKQPNTRSGSKIRPIRTKAVNFRNCRTVSSRGLNASKDWRTISTTRFMSQGRTNLAAQPSQAKKSAFCGVLAQPSSCNGTPCRRRCSGRYSTLPDRSASCWRRRSFAGRSRDFCTSTRVTRAATNVDGATRFMNAQRVTYPDRTPWLPCCKTAPDERPNLQPRRPQRVLRNQARSSRYRHDVAPPHRLCR
ncbi:hypothetical protein BRSPCE3_24990 [Bradyrhizobium sp. Ce-3]|nr:hypothetical protein BRSPCE3_24990 [Bradyrhizobium sp. Ce-3]